MFLGKRNKSATQKPGTSSGTPPSHAHGQAPGSSTVPEPGQPPMGGAAGAGLVGLTPEGSGGAAPAGGTSGGTGGEIIFDVTTSDIEARVLQTSMQTPVLVDFWAPWCGPCKQLTPVLEQSVKQAGGKVLLAKVNIDENPDLAQAFQIQSVPTVMAVFQGKPVTGFTGAKPQSEIDNLVQQLAQMAGSAGGQEQLDIPQVLQDAAEALAAGDVQTAQQLYQLILQQDSENAAAYAGLIRTFIAAGALEQAQMLVDQAPEAISRKDEFTAARTALEMATQQPAGDIAELEARLKSDPNDYQARYDLAGALFAKGRSGAAIDHMLDLVARARDWEDDKARKQLLKFFEALGPADPAVMEGRRKLSRILFS